jgi:hypothetical protein
MVFFGFMFVCSFCLGYGERRGPGGCCMPHGADRFSTITSATYTSTDELTEHRQAVVFHGNRRDILAELLAHQFEASLCTLQHHAAQLILCLPLGAEVDVPWVGHAWTDGNT